MKPITQKLLLPYQQRYLKDTSPLKIAEKSRRVGFTYVQALEDVLDAVNPTKPMDVWFSSADDSAAGEYIKYCASWARVLNIVAMEYGEHVIDEKHGLKARTVQFNNGKSIYGLSSNPRAYRSKGGKVVLDEFAFHDNAEELYKATQADKNAWLADIQKA